MDSEITSQNLVLQSEDLLTIILSLLNNWDINVSETCYQWKNIWNKTKNNRRGLRSRKKINFRLKGELRYFHLKTSYDGTKLFLFKHLPNMKYIIDIYDQDMNNLDLPVKNIGYDILDIDIEEDNLYLSCIDEIVGYPEIRKHNVKNNTEIIYQHQISDHVGEFSKILLGPNNILLAHCPTISELYTENIFIFNSQTLDMLGSFMPPKFCNFDKGVCIYNDYIYISDTINNCIKVYSIKSVNCIKYIKGIWSSPNAIAIFKDRLYLIENVSEINDYNHPLFLQGRRIIIMNLEGELLNIYSPKEWHTPELLLCDISIFNNNLIVKIFVSEKHKKVHSYNYSYCVQISGA